MLRKLLEQLDRRGHLIRARAHCDVPCGIYDTGPLIYHAVSVVRLMDQYHEASDADFIKRARLVAQKEEQAEKVKHEARVIWGDYFKADQIAKHPEIHELTHSIMQTASKCKHEAHREDGERLVNLCNEFAEAFWDTKDVPTTKAPCPYPPNLAVVYPRLQG